MLQSPDASVVHVFVVIVSSLPRGPASGALLTYSVNVAPASAASLPSVLWMLILPSTTGSLNVTVVAPDAQVPALATLTDWLAGLARSCPAGAWVSRTVCEPSESPATQTVPSLPVT